MRPAPLERPERSPDLPVNLPAVLHLGCGRRKADGAFGVDVVADSAADLVWDLGERPWPLPDNAFEKIILIDVLEHLADVVGVMEEVYRVARPGAEVIVQSPFASSHHLWTDPTHLRGLTSRSFKYFTDEFARQNFAYSEARFSVEHVEYRMHAPKWYDRILMGWANRNKFKYERRFMYWFPAENIYFVLRVQKAG